MEEEGFVLSTLENRKQQFKQLRGCQYINTVKREMYMAQCVENMLKKEGFLGGNIPLKVWLYDQDFEKALPQYVKNECKQVSKYCGVFETRGEKRAATHLLQGINILLLMIALVHREQINHQEIIALFPADRQTKKKEENPAWIAVPHNPFIDYIDIEQFLKAGGMKHALETKSLYSYVKRESLVNAAEQLDGVKIEGAVNWEAILAKISEQIKLAPEELASFKRQAQVLKALSLKDLLKTVALLFGKIGTDIGKTIRIFLENEFNWGYYSDHEDYVFHNNAHPNNFVVLPDLYGNEQLLAPLDFDMAYFRNEFININYTDPTYGMNDRELFDTYTIQSITALEFSLVGLENMENFKYQTFDCSKYEQPVL